MNDKYMGRRCRFAKECHVYQGLVQLNKPLFLVKNIYCNNGSKWWQQCNIYQKLVKGEEIDESIVPDDELRQ